MNDDDGAAAYQRQNIATSNITTQALLIKQPIVQMNHMNLQVSQLLDN